ncbi:MAG: hypothetical protein PF961_16940, partial [Planctomycetota bacterium]|nr:hypothetical protein [Planctomycetota bacterium]
MRIAAASIATASDHQLQIREQQSLRVEFRRDQNATQNIQARPPSAPARSDTTSGETTQLPELDAESQRILDILERVFGARIRTSPVVPKPHAVTLEPPSATGPAVEAPRFGWSLAIDHSYQYEEHERTSFAVAGSVTTDDGRSLDLTYQLELSRDYVTTTTFSLRAGDPIDPLVLDLDGGGVAFTSARYQFDLNADGQTEGLRAFADSSAFLAHDRNGDGRIADGSELFGPRSGSGFAELAALDDDGNGFIDAGDSAFH